MHSLRSTLLHSKQQSILVAELVPFAIATVFISLRIFSRRLKRAKLWLDDYFAICTYVSFLGIDLQINVLTRSRFCPWDG